MVRDLGAAAVAFLCGSIPFGLIVVRLGRGVDVRTVGSGNIGATNAARAAGPVIGVIVLLLDGLKGALAVILGRALAQDPVSPLLAGTLPFAAVAGHVFTPWLRFKGGKGVATALGVLAVIDWKLLAVGLPVFVLVLAVSRIVSLASVVAALAVAAAALWRSGLAPATVGVVITVGLVIWRHEDNLKRLLAGVEPRLGGRPPSLGSAP